MNMKAIIPIITYFCRDLYEDIYCRYCSDRDGSPYPCDHKFSGSVQWHTECADNLVSGRREEDHIAHHGSLRAAALLCPGSLDSEQTVWAGRSMVRFPRGGSVIAGSVECVSFGI